MFDPGHSLFCPTCACIVRRDVSPPRQCCPARSSENLSHLDGKPADLATFRQAWANECQYVVITASVASSLAVCATAFCCHCFVSSIHFWWWVQGGHVRGVQRLQLYLQNLLTSTPRADLELSSLIRLRLGLGFALTSWCAFVFVL